MTLKKAVFGWVGKHWWKLLVLIILGVSAYAIWQWIKAGIAVEPAKTSQDEVMDEDETV